MTKTILVVEDNPLNMKLFSNLLRSQGYAVVERVDATDIAEAVSAAMPDLILMDIQLPTISGLEATKILKSNEALSQIPIIAVTAFAMNGDRERAISAGCDDYISKPIQVVPFLTQIAERLAISAA